MKRRLLLSAVVVLPIVAALTACGDPGAAPLATEPTVAETIPASVPPPVLIAHPVGPDDVVLKLSYEGGLVPAGYDFANVPDLIVTGDGRVFHAAPFSTPYPGPLIENIVVRRISEDGTQALLRFASDAGLLATPPVYEDRHNVADAPDTVVTVNAAGGSFVHRAYGLGIGDPETGARKRLFDVTSALADVDAVVGESNLEPEDSFDPTTYRLQARQVETSELGQEPAPTIVDWPAGTGVALADATECARVDRAVVGSLFDEATQHTFFRDGDGLVYHVSVRGVLPGDPAC